MGYRLLPYTREWEAAVARSNARLRASGSAPFYLPEKAPEAGLREHHLAVDDDDEVRGGCLFQRHQAWVDGESAPALNLQSPLSEGLFDLKHAGVGPWMMREAVRRYPFTYCVGMGNAELPFPRLLRALRWRVEPVPFFFRVIAGRRFLASMQPVRKHPKLGVLAAIGGAIPMLPDVAANLAHAWRAAPRESPVLGGSASWESVRGRYAFGVERTPELLKTLYSGLRRIEVPGGLGFLRTSHFEGHKYFGSLSVATLVEAICEPGSVRALLRASLSAAREERADLLVTNQSAPELDAGLRAEGWISSASNYLVGLSPPLSKRVGDRAIYVNRGDGDGLLNL